MAEAAVRERDEDDDRVVARLEVDSPAVSARVAGALSAPVGPELVAGVVELVRASAEPLGRLTRREWLEVNVAAAAVVSFAQALQLTCVRELDRAMQPTLHDASDRGLAVRTAHERTTVQLRTDLETEAARVDPDHTSRAAAAGVARRDVALAPSPLPGCLRLRLDLPAVVAAGAWNALNGAAVSARAALARAGGDDDRTVPQLRADLAAGLLTGQTAEALGLGPLDIPSGAALLRHAEVSVVVGADTLAGRDDLPARLPGVGPVDTATARALAASAPLRRLVADPRGRLVHRGARVTGTSAGGDVDERVDALLGQPVREPDELSSESYRPGARLRGHVATRDQTCIGPACDHPARGLELDHTIEWGRRRDGRVGETRHDNLGSACHRVHDAKTHGGWQLEQHDPGSFTWTSPTGRTYDVNAPPLLPGWTDTTI